MSVKDTDKVDRIGLDEKDNCLVLLIIDPYGFVIDEKSHLYALQEKLNNYIGFIKTKEYNRIYENKEFTSFRIEIAFKYEPSDNCARFLAECRHALKDEGIRLKYFTAEVG